MPDSIFFDFVLPNPTTWFYFSGLLAVALFFKFSRLLSVRNWDVLTLFLLVPGLLLLLESRNRGTDPRFGYIWLLCGSGYFLVRCLWDLALVRRPALSPNLNLGGLAWLAGALFISLIGVAGRQSSERSETSGKGPVPISQAQIQVESFAESLDTHNGIVHDVGVTDIHKWVGETLAVLCHLSIVVGLIIIGYRHFQDTHTGMAAATFYLLLPYTYMLLPYSGLRIGEWHHVLPMALMVWAIAAYRLPLLAGGFLGLAAAALYFPVLVFPIWLSFYWRRGAGRFATAFVVTASTIGGLLWANGQLAGSIQNAIAQLDWQLWKVSQAPGIWKDVYAAYRMPVVIAFLAFVLITAFWPSPKNLAHVLALSAVVLIGIQFWWPDQGGIYVLWYLPLLLLLVFRPNLTERRPLPIVPETDWLTRMGRWMGRIVMRLLQPSAPVAQVR